MKILILFIILGLHGYADAKPSSKETILLSANYQTKKVIHNYILKKAETVKPRYTLTLKQKGKKDLVRVVSEHQAQSWQTQATRLIWRSEYGRKPASRSRSVCKSYVKLKSFKNKSDICHENKLVAQLSYGLLNQMKDAF